MSIITHNSVVVVFHLDEIQDSIQVFKSPLTSFVLVTGKNSHMVTAKGRTGPHSSFPFQAPACPTPLVFMLHFLSVCHLYRSKMRSASPPPEARRHLSMKFSSNSNCCRYSLQKGSVTSSWTAFPPPTEPYLILRLAVTELQTSVPVGWTL